MVETQSEKLHAACDECRTRKLKCSGEAPACSRCEKEKITCVYSPQKPMGRPRKRRREEAASEQATDTQAQTSPTRHDYPIPSYNDTIGLISPPDLTEYSGLADFPSHDGLTNALLPPSYPETSLAGGFAHEAAVDLNFGVDSIDPSLWNAQPNDPNLDSGTTTTPSQSDSGPCSCLSIMYLALSDLQSLENFSFPAVIPRLRGSMFTVTTIINCPKCPRESFSAVQNVSSVSSLLSAIAERFHRVLNEISSEADRMEKAGEKKSFRVGDNSPENMHLHTGTLDCPMGFDIKIDPKDWRRLAKQAVKTEVLGGGSNPHPLISLIDEMEKRQRRWHTDKTMHTEEREKLYGAENMCRAHGDEGTCLRMVRQVRRMVDRMDWE